MYDSRRHLFFKRPLVYTTKLEDMKILKKDLSKTKFKDSIKIIIAESKPCYKNIKNKSNNSEKNKYWLKNLYFKKLNLYRIRNDYTNIHQEISLYNFQNENRRGEFITYRSNKVTAAKSENQTGESKLKSLLALCKPLRVILEDIIKTIPKEVYQEDKIISIPSSSDEEIQVEAENVNKFYTIRNIDEYKDVLIKKDLTNCAIVFHNQFLQKLNVYEIDESCTVVHRTNAKTTLRIQNYKFQRIKPNSVFYIPVCCWRQRQHYILLLKVIKKYCNIAKCMHTRHQCKPICVCCCSKDNKRCNDNNLRQLDKDGSNNVIDLTESDANEISHSSNKASVLILNALVYKKDSKWKSTHEKLKTLNFALDRIDKMECNSLLKLCNNNGATEIYEFRNGDQIFSKLVTSGKDVCSWLSKTLSKPRKLITHTFNSPLDRASQIGYINNSMNISVSNYLRTPTPRDYIALDNKRNLSENKGILDMYSFRVEYTRCFMGARNKYRPVVPILSQEFIPKISAQADNQPKGQELASEQIKNVIYLPSRIIAQDQQTRQYLAPATKKHMEELITSEIPVQVDYQEIEQCIASPLINDIEKNVSQCINSLIKNILYRFRDINLTINSKGKVSASLSAPLSSLSPSELKILSDILKRAQKQVDELGLTNKKLNADTQKLLEPNYSKRSYNNVNKKVLKTNPITTYIPYNINDVATYDSTKINSMINTTNVNDSANTSDSNKYKVQVYSCEKKTNNPVMTCGDVSAKNKHISKFSTWVNKKKNWYDQNFRGFLYATEFNQPKIVEVFSLQADGNEDSRAVSEISEDTMEGYESGESDSTNIKTEIVEDFTITRNNCINEIQQQMSLLDDEIKSMALMGPKRTLDTRNEVESIIIKKKKENGE